MRNPSYGCIRLFVLALLLEILLSPISHVNGIYDTRRAKRDASVRGVTSQAEGNAEQPKEIREMNSRGGRYDDGNNNDDLEADDAARKATHLSSRENEEDSDTNRAMTKRERETSDSIVRVARDANAALDRYTDQDERSSLYDDYEAKDVAKRGVLGGPEDYEEVEEDSPTILKDIAAVREQGSVLADEEIERTDSRSDGWIKRDREVSGPLNEAESDGARVDDAASGSIDAARQQQSRKISADNPYPRQVSRIDASRGISEESGPAPNSRDASDIEEPTNALVSSKGDDANGGYEKRVEERIQRKIDSIKDEIQRDIETQRRIKDIRDNNARFDDLRDLDYEEGQEEEEGEESRKGFEDESMIEKRRSADERSPIGGVDVAASTSTGGKEKRYSREEQREKLQRRSIEISKKEDAAQQRLSSKSVKKRSASLNRDESSELGRSKGLFKKKRERARRTILVKDDHRAEKRRSRSYALPSERRDARSESESGAKQNSNSYLRSANDKMVSSPLAGEGALNEGERGSPGGHPNSLVSLAASSQELSPRLATEYREAFGGSQSEPGSGSLARFKRIKRVLDGSDMKHREIRDSISKRQ